MKFSLKKRGYLLPATFRMVHTALGLSTEVHAVQWSDITITYLSTHNNRPDRVMLHKTTKETHSVDIATPNSHNIHSTITERFQKYANLKESL
jgi:hypothetical protein